MNYFALIDPRMPAKAVNKLESFDITIIKVPLTSLVEDPVSGHPDIQIFLYKNKAFVHPDINNDFLKEIDKYCEVVICTTKLSSRYPEDVSYNIAVTGRFAFHKKGATDPVINKYLASEGIEIINVSQGYSKCSTLIADEKSIITADTSIHRGALVNGIDSLLITPGYISLPGYKYGFIGGASGRFRDKILFTGNIDHHPDKKRIYEFIESKNLETVLLSDEPAVDTGSILISEY